MPPSNPKNATQLFPIRSIAEWLEDRLNDARFIEKIGAPRPEAPPMASQFIHSRLYRTHPGITARYFKAMNVVYRTGDLIELEVRAGEREWFLLNGIVHMPATDSWCLSLCRLVENEVRSVSFTKNANNKKTLECNLDA